MVDTTALESLLHEIEQNEGVQEAMLVSRAGTYLGGSFPRGVHVDTFGSMFAVLVGSAMTITDEAKDSLESVVIHSKSNKYLIVHAGRKAPASTTVTAFATASRKCLSLPPVSPSFRSRANARARRFPRRSVRPLHVSYAGNVVSATATGPSPDQNRNGWAATGTPPSATIRSAVSDTERSRGMTSRIPYPRTWPDLVETSIAGMTRKSGSAAASAISIPPTEL